MRRSISPNVDRQESVLRDCWTCWGTSGCNRSAVSRIAIKDKGRILLIEATELISAEAHGNYVLLQKKAGSYLLRATMAGIAEKLKPYGFIRIHRSVLVNGAFVNTIQCGSGSNYILQTSSRKEYHVSRTYRENLRGLTQFWIGTEGFGLD